MKKTILIVAAMLAAVVASAQMTSKKGNAILPESGDWSIGVDATSTLEYFGNLMNGSNDAPSFGFTSGQTITGKMMKDANTAYRVRARVGFNSNTDNAYDTGIDDGSGSTFVVEQKTSDINVDLGVGIQKYRGKGRLQGIYGAEATIMFSSGSESWDSETLSAEVTGGGSFGLGVRGFIGAEYFFAPKMSLGGEFGWGLGISSTSETTTEVTVAGTTSKTTGGGGSSFGIDTDNVGGAINLNLYF
jgi:hypothetical protein